MAYAESLRAGWLLTWRGVVAGLVIGITSSLFTLIFVGLLSSAGIAIPETTFSRILGVVLYIFVLSSLLVRMMLDKEFSGFVIEGVRPQREEGELTLSYGQSVRAGWLLTWRSAALYLACIVALGLVIRIVGILLGATEAAIRSIPSSPAVQAVSSPLVVLLGVFLITPWVVRMMTRKQFRGFHLEVRRP